MDNLLDFERCRAFINCQIQPDEGKPVSAKSPHQPHLAVTLSRQTGVGGHAVAEHLASWLDARVPGEGRQWTVFDRNLVERVLEDHHLPAKLAQFMTEARRSAIEDMVEELLGLHPSSWTMAQQTTETILKLAELGHVIFVGRGANRVTARLPHVFHVRLIGSEERRVDHVSQQMDLSKKAARAFVEREDQSKRRYLRKLFRADIDDPLAYHLTLNMDSLEPKAAAGVIGHAVVTWAGLPPASPPK